LVHIAVLQEERHLLIAYHAQLEVIVHSQDPLRKVVIVTQDISATAEQLNLDHKS